MFDKSDYPTIVAAAVSLLLSIALWFGLFGPDHRDAAVFVGLWVPSILSFGLYAKVAAGRRI